MREAGLLYFQNITDEELSPITMIYDQVDLLRYDKKWEFTRERLKLGCSNIKVYYVYIRV